MSKGCWIIYFSSVIPFSMTLYLIMFLFYGTIRKKFGVVKIH